MRRSDRTDHADDQRAIRELVGVYDAKGSLRGELAYALAKLVGRGGCALCDITHGGISRRPEFDRACAGAGIAFVLLHRDRCPDEVTLASEGSYPCVLAKTNDGLQKLLDRSHIEACDGAPDALMTAARQAASALGLRWPPNH